MLDPAIKEMFASGSDSGTISVHLPDGAIATHVTWVDADDEHVMVDPEPAQDHIDALAQRNLGQGRPAEIEIESERVIVEVGPKRQRYRSR